MPLKLYKRKSSPLWHIRGTVNGVRYEKSSGTADRQTAEQYRAKWESEIHHEKIFGRAATATFAQAVVSYLENGGSKKFLKPVLEHFGATPLAKIDAEAIQAGAAKIYPNVSPSTRNRQWYTPCLAVLHHAARKRLCPTPIIERPELPEDRVRWITYEEAEQLIAACSDHLRPLVVFLLYTGARAGEALWLDWSQVNLVRDHVSFLKTKNRKPRGVPLHPRVVAELANLAHRTGEVFRRPDGQPYVRPKSIDDTSAGTRIKTAFRAACRRAGITDFRVHAAIPGQPGTTRRTETWPSSRHWAAGRDPPWSSATHTAMLQSTPPASTELGNHWETQFLLREKRHEIQYLNSVQTSPW